MIVTGGRLRGRRLPVPAGDRVRPTPARAKEALFSILAPTIDDAVVLDCYAGSGALGIEALSRGAAFAAFVEADPRTADALRRTLAAYGLDERAHVRRGRAETIAPTIERRFTHVFADPPYAAPAPYDLFAALRARGRLAPGAIVVYEHAATTTPAACPGFAVERTARYGEVGMVFLRPETNDPE